MKATEGATRAYDAVLRDCRQALDGSVFLRRCRDGSVSRAELDDFLVQQFHYARHFTRYLCALLANLADDGDRAGLTANLFEEMGLGEAAPVPHSRIYRDMLASFGLDPALTPPAKETRDLSETMLRLCSSADPVVGLGALCLGAEAVVPYLYTQIRAALIAAGFPPAALRFFDIHIEGDDAHAETMRAIIMRELAKDGAAGERLEASAALIVRRRVAFLDAICIRARRDAGGQEQTRTQNDGGRAHAVQL